jgi:hypothetical protein
MGVFKMSTSVFDNNGLSNNNPDPNRYQIKNDIQKNEYLIVAIKYDNCINYEGEKVLVFKDCTLQQLKKQKFIDPHFSSNKLYHSPIARFEPTETGWSNAEKFINLLVEEN